MSSSSIAVGRATTEDVAAIAQFNIAMAAETEDLALDPQTVHAGVAAVVSDDRRGFYLVARSDGKAVGSLMITYEWSDWRNGNLWWIQSVYVVPSSRKQGIFRLLYDTVPWALHRQAWTCRRTRTSPFPGISFTGIRAPSHGG